MASEIFKKFGADRGKKKYIEYYGEKATRTIFHHDRAEVSYSPYFRRLAFRQYHIEKKGPENRTRLLHSIEVATIASGMANRLGLNTDLTEAIALGHDIAQPPCGYPADKVIDDFLGDIGGFDHGKTGSQILEWGSKKDGASKAFKKLNNISCYRKLDKGKMVTTLSEEVVDGISKHTPLSWSDKYSNPPLTLEGQLVRIADNLSYISQEIDEGLCLDKKYEQILLSYGGRNVFKNKRTREEKTKHELLRPQPGCPSDKQFVEAVFDVRVGPRLVAMIKRVEKYNKAMHKQNPEDIIDTKMNDESAIPVLKYDPTLEFIIDFLWDNFIGGVINEDYRVKRRIQLNREKISKSLEFRFQNPPTEGFEERNFQSRKEEVKIYYPDISENNKHKIAVANHIATLTDSQIDRMCRKK